jgi:hypothetical protein
MGHELTTTAVSVEQLRALAEKIREAKAGAVKEMKSAIEAMHEQGTLLVQAEMELGAAFDTWVDGLADQGIDPMAARYSMKVAKKHKDIKSCLAIRARLNRWCCRTLRPVCRLSQRSRGRGAWRLTRSRCDSMWTLWMRRSRGRDGWLILWCGQ